MQPASTIAAFSSPAVPAARIILRLNGPDAHRIAMALTNSPEFPRASATQQFIRFNQLCCPVWIYAFHAPHSYTGDDLIEFHLPGSPVLAKLLLDELLRLGADPAEPGEFTARAYFNGKLDLTEAEGVAATIAAGNESELRAARQLLAGELARRLAPITDALAHTLALIELGIDFSEEDVTFLAGDEVRRQITDADESLGRLIEQTGRFESLNHEPRIVMAGRPNAGKSSLVNALTGRRRAIVSSIAGTTRDVLSAPLDLARGRVLLIDIAGLDETTQAGQSIHDEIQSRMQARARSAIESADHVVLVRDVTDDRPPLDLSRRADLAVLTKSDLLTGPLAVDGILISVHTGSGVDRLLAELDRIAFGQENTTATLSLNRRHLLAITEARAALGRAAYADAAELIAADLREALDAVGSVVGAVTPDDVLGRVFSAFCIGK